MESVSRIQSEERTNITADKIKLVENIIISISKPVHKRVTKLKLSLF